jgi:hypothetical protein
MKVKIIKECGYEEALYGLSLSFKDRSISFEDWWTEERKNKLHNLVKSQSKRDGGHNKFLESINMWIELEAPRGFWQEYDTYRVGITKQSDSTIHTIQNRPLTLDDFEHGTDQRLIDIFNDILKEETKDFTEKGMLIGDSLERVKWNLPEGFLQNRVVCLNYKTLRNMFVQRQKHKLNQWHIFIDAIKYQCEFPDLLPEV